MTTSETRQAAREIKFVADLSMRPRIVDWARAHLDPDGHGAGIHADAYTTSTLYFETAQFDVYRRRGSYGLSKYRVRRYGLDDPIFLERKFRTGRLLAKRRTLVPIGDLERLAADRPDRAWEGYWFHRRLVLRRLRPLMQLSYDRIARVGTSSTGPVRMTIDANLAALPMPDRAFLPGVGMPFLQGLCIIEVKYRASLPSVFKQLVESLGLEARNLSKFRAGLQALDYPLPQAPDDQEDATPT